MDGNYKERHHDPHDIDRVYAPSRFEGERGRAVSSDKTDEISVKTVEYCRKTDGTEDSQYYVHSCGRDTGYAAGKALQEQIVDEIELERDSPEEPEHPVSESDLHHYQQGKAYG